MLPRIELGTLANLVLLSPDFDLPCEQMYDVKTTSISRAPRFSSSPRFTS